MSETASKGLKVLENVGVKYKTFFLLSLSYYHQIFNIMSGGHWATEKWGRIPKNKHQQQQQKNWRERLAMRTEETPFFFFFYSPPPSVQYRAECRSVFAYSRQQQSVLPQLLLHVPDQKHTNTHKVSHNRHTHTNQQIHVHRQCHRIFLSHRKTFHILMERIFDYCYIILTEKKSMAARQIYQL